MEERPSGNDKKRFLWRQSRPAILDPATGWVTNDRESSRPSSSFLPAGSSSSSSPSSPPSSSSMDRSSQCNEYRTAKVILLEEDGSSTAKPRHVPSSWRPNITTTQDLIHKKSLEKGKGNWGKEEKRTESQPQCSILQHMSCDDFAAMNPNETTTTASTSSSIGDKVAQDRGLPSSSSATAATTAQPTPKNNDIPPSSVVVTTAASVLLLMRYAVSEQALDCLASSSNTTSSPSYIHLAAQDDGERQPKLSAMATTTNPKKQPSSSVGPIKRERTTTSHKRHVSMESETSVATTATSTSIITTSMPLEEMTAAVQSSKATVNSSTASSLCPKRLAMPEDPNELNSLHCFVRKNLLEVFELPPQKKKGKPGRVGLRCVFCSHLPRKDRSGTTMCSFYPKSLQDLYRSVMTWQRIHFRVCKWVQSTCV